MTTEPNTTPLALLQSIDTDPGEAVTADLEVALCFIEACESFVCSVKEWAAITGTPPGLSRGIKNLDIMLGEAKDKVTVGRENAAKLVDAVFDAKRAARA